jgi:hypothetical protein
MPDELPTPEELGEKLKRGEITKEEAIEVMTERARREAFASLYGPMAGTAGAAAPSAGARRPWKAIAAFVLLLLAAMVLLWLLLRVLA